MLETKRQAATGPTTEHQSSRRKRRRNRIVLPAFFLAVLLVGGVAFAAKVMSPNGSGANSLAQAIAELPRTTSVAMLEQERQQLILMNAAVDTLAVAAKPVMVNAAQVIASQSAAASSATSTGPTVYFPPPDPAAAQATAYAMMPSFGFSQKTQWTCLLDIWNHESNWIYDAENPTSGAYGIPQALPGDKMASAGADWLTDPTTQIRWGLGYIKTYYGNPCVAYNFDIANGGY